MIALLAWTLNAEFITPNRYTVAPLAHYATIGECVDAARAHRPYNDGKVWVNYSCTRNGR